MDSGRETAIVVFCMAKSGRVFINQSVSFPPALLAAAKKRAANLGLPFSAYVRKCVERDLKDRPVIVFAESADESHLLVADEPAATSASRSGRPRKSTG